MENLRAEPIQRVKKPSAGHPIIDPGRLGAAILKYKRGILFLVMLSLLAGYLGLSGVRPVYQATATLLIERPAVLSKAVTLSKDGSKSSNKDEEVQSFLQTQHEILRSRSLAEAVVAELNLTEQAEFNPEMQTPLALDEFLLMRWLKSLWPMDADNDETPEQPVEGVAPSIPLEQVVAIFMERLSVEPVRNTQLVDIRFSAFDPEMAARVANAVADQYISTYMTVETAQAVEGEALSSEDLEAVHQRLLESEARLNRFQQFVDPQQADGIEEASDPGQNDQGQGGRDNDEVIAELTVRNVALKRARIEAENIYDRVVIFGAPPPVEYLLQLPEIVGRPLVAAALERQKNAQSRVDELAKTYGAKHPKMISAQAELTGFKKDLETQLLDAALDVESEYQAALEKERASSRQLSMARQRLQDAEQVISRQSELEMQLISELTQEVESNRTLYEGLMTRVREIPTPIPGATVKNARVVDSAVTPGLPSKPDTLLVYLILGIAALMVGIARAWMRSLRDNTIQQTNQVDEFLHLPVLGSLPIAENTGSTDGQGESPIYEGVQSSADSPFAEAVRSLRTSLILSRVDRTCKVILVTSSQQGEGKSTLALNLAEALGKHEEVLLMDADLRRSMLAASLNISLNAPGLTDLIANTAEIEQCLHPLKGTRASVMPAGSPPGNPEEVLSSRKFQMVLAVLKKLHDRIIIDTGPTLAGSDATILSEFADTIIYVVKAGETQVPKIQEGVRRLQEAEGAIAGVVLNQVSSVSLKKQFEQRKYPTYTEPESSETKVPEEPLITIQRKEPTGIV
ncbi:hypothetical protein BTA51_00205 [Hahella sp. CCB-MM4]|uniref:GumC family protein n=1 Tax=Hahella sp. (strain CCB-MM4) TaxID=1926491 RepID=UPI000B9A221E|nr:polysaccharide biosynthesis tyrosine autokinase [Hahella sp. CCB-MM4]OZG74872.1 hypothetical protein BTA51_00205 [Hahella sp. CCB-MM4]